MSSGFTLMEAVVVLGVLAALAAVLTPIVAGYLDDARVQRARADARTLADALLSVQRDLGDFPVFRDGSDRTLDDASTYDVLIGPGRVPSLSGAGWSAAHDGGSDADGLSDQLVENAPGYPTEGRFAWRGPYTESPSADPWGSAYLVNARNLRPARDSAAYVLSAGPDGVVETAFSQDRTGGSVAPAGDDVLVRVR